MNWMTSLEQVSVRKDEPLLVRGNVLLVLYHTLDHVDGFYKRENRTYRKNLSLL